MGEGGGVEEWEGRREREGRVGRKEGKGGEGGEGEGKGRGGNSTVLVP